ncbi:MAG: DNA polymerase domain-containing protein [Deinococcales bacterium]
MSFNTMNANVAQHWLEGWDHHTGIVSLEALPNGKVTLWRRINGQIVLEQDTFMPWLYCQKPSHNWRGIEILELEGQGAYKFLLRCSDWNRLRRITGQSRDNPNFYAVGLTEQYLMQTGRTAFKGLEYKDLKRLQFDLETTALSAKDGAIFLIAVRDSSGFETLLEGSESEIILALIQTIQERDPDVLENHNIFGFDLPFLQARAEVHGITLVLGRNDAPLRSLLEQRPSMAGREIIDTLDAVWRHDFVTRELPSHRLKDVAKHYGLQSKDRIYLEGASIESTYRSSPERVRAYALEDVREVDKLSQKLLPASFALTQLAPRRFERVASAGTATGIFEPMLVRAYKYAGLALPKSDCATLPTPHEGGAVYLFRSGLAKNVVKADIASLYPSIIRTYEISPSCDHLGVTHQLISQMLERRLEHKRLAKLEKNSPHDAMQAALKLVLNSAYGYLGAGEMALFADRRAADQITRIGREILASVNKQLEQAGMMLLEADTDGVFFATHLAQDAAITLVEQISDTLPQGIRLEFDDLYPAMLSHDIKNYGLLRQNNSVLLRGVNFRSSRFEPFFTELIEKLITAALKDQPEEIRLIYLKARAQIISRDLPAKALATRVRLRKSVEQYSASRTKLRETAYEAMLQSGRTWQRGQKIRLYKTQNGYSILPADENNDPHELANDYDIGYYLGLLERIYIKKIEHTMAKSAFQALFSSQADLFSDSVQLLWLNTES